MVASRNNMNRFSINSATWCAFALPRAPFLSVFSFSCFKRNEMPRNNERMFVVVCTVFTYPRRELGQTWHHFVFYVHHSKIPRCKLLYHTTSCNHLWFDCLHCEVIVIKYITCTLSRIDFHVFHINEYDEATAIKYVDYKTKQ